jgi:hypothetical protein
MRTKKITKDRKAIARRMTAVRQLKKAAVEKGRKPSSVKRDVIETRCDAIIEAVVMRQPIRNGCPHLLVGSSLFWKFLGGGYDVTLAHSYFRTPIKNRITGMSGEVATRRTLKGKARDHQFVISRLAPWACATPDFITEKDGQYQTVEVKTFSKVRAATAFFRKMPDRTVVQVWLSMEFANLHRGTVRVYWKSAKAKTVTLIGVIHVLRSASFFSQALYTLSALRWVDFMEEYFREHQLDPVRDYLNTAILNLARRFPSKPEKEDPEEQDQLSALRFDVRPPVRECTKFLGSQLAEEGVRTETKVHPGYFSSWKFVSRSKLTSSVNLDEGRRDKLELSLLTGISRLVFKRLKDILEKLEVRSSTTQLMTKAEQAHLEAVAERPSSAEVERLKAELAATQLKLADANNTNKRKDETIKDLLAENEELRQMLGLTAGPTKRQKLAAYRKKMQLRRTKSKVATKQPGASETADTRRPTPRRK